MLGVQPQNAAPHRVEGARPQQPRGDTSISRLAALLQHFRHDLLGAPDHSLRRPPRERQHQNARRIHAVQHQVRGTVCERIGLSGAGARQDQQRARFDSLALGCDRAEGGGPSLRGVQFVECAGGFRLHHKNYIGGLYIYPDIDIKRVPTPKLLAFPARRARSQVTGAGLS